MLMKLIPNVDLKLQRDGDWSNVDKNICTNIDRVHRHVGY